MAFGPLIDIPILSGAFLVLNKFKNGIINFITKIRIPKLILALLTSIPLIILEEHINCGAYGCTSVILPPTLLFILVMELFFFLLLKIVPIKTVFWQTIFLSFLGVVFELFLGAARIQFQQLIKSNLFEFILVVIWTAFSYAFVLYFPLLILKNSGTQKNATRA